jgi:hypothetical protein
MDEKRAIVDVSVDLMSHVHLLVDYGLEIVCSFATLPEFGVVRLGIRGDALPDFCLVNEGTHAPSVSIVFETEYKDGQQLNRIAEIRCIDDSLPDFSAMAFA